MAENLEIVQTKARDLETSEGAKKRTLDQIIKDGVADFGQIATFDVATDDDKAQLFNAVNTAESLSEYEGTPLAIVNFVFTEPSSKYQDNESCDVATILVDADGNAYYSMSMGVFESTKQLIQTFGAPSTWNSPKNVILMSRQTKNGLPYKYLSM